MKVLSHRGYWIEPAEKNTATAFKRSFDLGFGTETDVRDCAGRLLISHDMPAGHEMSLSAFASTAGVRELPLALNVKADGLADSLAREMLAARVVDWFVFDMAIPDMRAHLKIGNPVFTRMSEVEREPAWLEEARGVWLDGFDGIWFDSEQVRSLLRRGKRVCVVSPELHGRDQHALWSMLLPLASEHGLMLCTDKPEEARALLADNSSYSTEEQ